jgi:hypothetical protein
MEHAKHIIRAVLLLVMIGIVFVLVRHFAIPETFGMYGHYRAASIAEHADRILIHGAPGACAQCHDEQAEAASEGKHGSVSCEVCHAPLGSHIEADEKVADMPVNRTTRLCGWCHQRLVSRPKDFPQVNLSDHVIEKGGEPAEAVCLECHDAHNPSE